MVTWDCNNALCLRSIFYSRTWNSSLSFIRALSSHKVGIKLYIQWPDHFRFEHISLWSSIHTNGTRQQPTWADNYCHLITPLLPHLMFTVMARQPISPFNIISKQIIATATVNILLFTGCIFFTDCLSGAVPLPLQMIQSQTEAMTRKIHNQQGINLIAVVWMERRRKETDSASPRQSPPDRLI